MIKCKDYMNAERAIKIEDVYEMRWLFAYFGKLVNWVDELQCM